MARIPVVDTHVHFFDLGHPDLRYIWLEPDFVHPILGDIDAMKSRRFDAEALWAEARFADVTGFVHVQAALGTADPVTETDWLTAMRETSPVPFTIVGHLDLAAEDAAAVLDRHQRSPYVVGVRDFATEPYLAAGTIDTATERSLDLLADRGLVLDLDCAWENMPAAAEMADRHPDLTIVLEHLGFPRRRDDEYFGQWSAALRRLAQAPNVLCKISGVGMTDPRGDAGSFRRWIQACLESFTPARCLLGSNWPLDRLVSSYDAILQVYRDELTGLSEPDRHAVAHGNAEAVYRLGQG